VTLSSGLRLTAHEAGWLDEHPDDDIRVAGCR
jgi:hypothetical protein